MAKSDPDKEIQIAAIEKKIKHENMKVESFGKTQKYILE